MSVPLVPRRVRRSVFALGVVLSVALGVVPAAAAQSAADLGAEEYPRASSAASSRADDLDPGFNGSGVPDPQVLREAVPEMLRVGPGDLWSMADAAAIPLDSLWSPPQGAYVARSEYVAESFPRARMNAEMLLVHAHAAEAGHVGVTSRPERIEPLVRLLTGPMYLAALDGKPSPRPKDGRSTTIHAPGFTDATRDPQTMHQALDAVVMRALAAAWRVRDVVGLSEEARALIRDRVTSVARSPFWRFPGRLLNQINWNADVYAADAEVSGDPTLLRKDYRDQLIWFTDQARKPAFRGGTSNLASGLGFHYAPNRPAGNVLNQTDTAEYASIALGALGYLDQATAAGMPSLPARTRTTLRRWMRRVAYGNWTASGYLNWDSGKSVQRLHLTQYWLLALRGFATGLEGSQGAGFMVDQKATARAVTIDAVALYRRRARDAWSVILPSSAYGFAGSALVATSFDGLTGTARFASTVTELAERGLDGPGGRAVPLPNAYAHDASLGRLAVTTSRYSTALVRPWAPLNGGGIEPARLFDAYGRALTGVGGSEEGTLGLRVSAGGATQISTQPGRKRRYQSALALPRRSRDHAGLLNGPLTVRATDAGYKVGLSLVHRLQPSTIRTTYRLRVDRSDPVTGVMRVPTYGKRGRTSLRLGQTFSRTALRRTLRVTARTGGRFDVRFQGLPPGTRGRVVRVAAQRGNPTPAPELRIEFPLKKGRTTITRTITVPAVG